MADETQKAPEATGTKTGHELDASDFSFMGGKMGGFAKYIPLIKASIQGTISTGLGAAQGISALIAHRKAKGLEPPLVDQAQATALSDLRRRRKAFESGSAISPFVRPLRQVQSQATLGALRAQSGLKGISKAQRVAGNQISNLISRGIQQGDNIRNTEIQLQNLISRRKLDLTRIKQAKQEAKAASMFSGAVSNITTGALM